MNADELYADELVVKVRALRNRIDVLEREQTRTDVRLIEVEAERDALRAALGRVADCPTQNCPLSGLTRAALASVRGDA